MTRRPYRIRDVALAIVIGYAFALVLLAWADTQGVPL